MQINEKEEYLKFMIIIKIRYNIELCKIRLKYKEEKMKSNPYNLLTNEKYNNTLKFYNENIRILKELFNIEITNNINILNNEIINKWPIILEYLKNKKCSYEWVITDFEDARYYQIYEYVTSYDLYLEIKRTKKDTDPIYFEFSRLRVLDDRFNTIFEDIIYNNLFNPNKRTVKGSYEPFWACHISFL